MKNIESIKSKIPEITFSLKIDKVKKSDLIKITSQNDSYEVLKNLYNYDTIDYLEEVILLCLNRANKLVGFSRISTGGMTGCIMDPKVIFTIALNMGASAIIISHNHPSGNLNPSKNDNEITKKIKDGGKLLDIALLDHIILTDESYFSYSAENLL